MTKTQGVKNFLISFVPRYRLYTNASVKKQKSNKKSVWNKTFTTSKAKKNQWWHMQKNVKNHSMWARNQRRGARWNRIPGRDGGGPLFTGAQLFLGGMFIFTGYIVRGGGPLFLGIWFGGITFGFDMFGGTGTPPGNLIMLPGWLGVSGGGIKVFGGIIIGGIIGGG